MDVVAKTMDETHQKSLKEMAEPWRVDVVRGLARHVKMIMKS